MCSFFQHSFAGREFEGGLCLKTFCKQQHVVKNPLWQNEPEQKKDFLNLPQNSLFFCYSEYKVCLVG